MQKWEYKRIVVQSNSETRTDKGFLKSTYYYFGRLEGGDWKEREIEQLGRDGWELVGVVPLVGGCVRDTVDVSWGVSYTIGACLLFKRPLP
ncbi:MAG: hypothetical protein MN733_10550 [Nitrososphaera sp.]|nr:hypothetical protein [Nitrososphaera sp.]